MPTIIPTDRIVKQIFLIRGQKVILSPQLAELYGVEPRVLVQAVRRNQERFPDDFMFQLSRDEYFNLKSQIVISSWGGLRRAWPYAFTEQGVAMLSSVLRSPQAIQVNIAIMRAFVKLRQVLATHHELVRRLELIERKLSTHDGLHQQHASEIQAVFSAIRELMALPAKRRRKIGFAMSDHART